MRIIEYQMRLRAPYCIVSDPQIRRVDDSGTGVRAPRIRLRFDDCDNLEAFLASFRCVVRAEEARITSRKRKMLLGLDRDWRLTGVRVASGLLWFDYVSPQRYQECLEQHDKLPELPVYHMALVSELQDGVSARLRFETPTEDPPPPYDQCPWEDDALGDVSVTMVDIKYFGTVVVTEFDCLKRRQLEFSQPDRSVGKLRAEGVAMCGASVPVYDVYVREYL